MSIREKAVSEVYVDGKQAGAEIDRLEDKVKSLRKEMNELRKANDLVGYEKKKNELKQYQTALNSAKKQLVDVEKVLKNLNGASLKDLTTAQKKLTAELRVMSRTDPKYKEKAAQLKLLNNELTKTRNEMRGTANWTSNAAEKFNKYFGVITAGIAAFTGVAYSIKELIKGNVDLDDSLSNVMKTTSLTRKEARQLYSELKGLNTRTPRKELLLLAEEAGRLGKRGKKDIMEFVEVGNKIKVALGDDLGGNAEEAIKQVGKLVGIYKIGEKYGKTFGDSMEMVGSMINAVSAGSQAQAPFLIEMLKRMGGISDQARIGADKIAGLASTLDNLGQTSEMSSTAIGKTIINMFTDTEEYANVARMSVGDFTKLLKEDSNEAFIKFLEGLNGNNEGLSVMAGKLDGLGLDGARAVQVLASLSGNTKLLREQQSLANAELIKATSLSDEYNTKNESMAGNLAIIGQRFRAFFVNSELNKGLEKAVGSVVKWAKVPLSASLKKEQTEVNRLAIELTNSNTSEARRKEILDELNRISPDIVKGLDAENIETGKLIENLKKYNDLQIKKIALKDTEETLADSREKAGSATEKRLEAEIELEERLLAMYGEVKRNGNETIAEQINTIIHSNDTLINKELAVRKVYEDNMKLYTLSPGLRTRAANASLQLTDTLEGEKEATDEVTNALKNYEDRYKRIFDLDSGGSPGTGDNKSAESKTEKLGLPSKAEIENALANLELSFKQEQALLNRQLYEKEMSQEQYHVAMLSAEIGYLNSLKLLQERSGVESIDTDIKLWNKKIELQQYWLEALKTAEADVDGWDDFVKEAENEIQLEFDKEAKITKDKETELKKRKELHQQYVQAISGLLTALGDFQESKKNKELKAAGDNEKKKEEIELKYAKKQQNIAAIQAVVQGALGIVKTGANLGYPLAIPFQIAQGLETLAQIALIKSQGFFEGGYTGDGQAGDVAGLVHKKEYVIPERLMGNAMVMDMVALLEAMRSGNSQGGNTREIITNSKVEQRMFSDPQLLSSIDKLNKALDKGLKAKLVYTEFEEFKAEVEDIREAVKA